MDSYEYTREGVCYVTSFTLCQVSTPEEDSLAPYIYLPYVDKLLRARLPFYVAIYPSVHISRLDCATFWGRSVVCV